MVFTFYPLFVETSGPAFGSFINLIGVGKKQIPFGKLPLNQ